MIKNKWLDAALMMHHLMYVFSWEQHSMSMVTTSISWPWASLIFMSLWPASSNWADDMMVR